MLFIKECIVLDEILKRWELFCTIHGAMQKRKLGSLRDHYEIPPQEVRLYLPGQPTMRDSFPGSGPPNSGILNVSPKELRTLSREVSSDRRQVRHSEADFIWFPESEKRFAAGPALWPQLEVSNLHSVCRLDH